MISFLELNRFVSQIDKYRFLRELLKFRGVTFTQKSNKEAIYIIKRIGYFNLKDFADSFLTNNKCYGLKFNKLCEIYRINRKLRMYVLHAIEIVEISLENSTSMILDRYCNKTNHGTYDKCGYLNFSRWFDVPDEKRFWLHHLPKRIKYASPRKRNLFINKSTRYYILNKQLRFKLKILKRMYKGNYKPKDIYYNTNRNKEGFPIAPLMVKLLTFGELMHVINNMNERCLVKLSKLYECKYWQLPSWVGCLHLVRNICAHNSNLINVKIKQPMAINNELSKFILRVPHKAYSKRAKRYVVYKDPSNTIGTIIFILKYIMSCKYISSKYNFTRIKKIFDNIEILMKRIVGRNNKIAHELGFKNVRILKYISFDKR